MKPNVKERSTGSTSEESTSQRPKRNACQKSIDANKGLLWREETDLKKALYASLQETTRRRNFDEEDEEEEENEVAENEGVAITPKDKSSTENAQANGEEECPIKAKVHAQRKFAQGSTPSSPVPTPVKVPFPNTSTTELLPCRRPKTEDFLTFLCLRGTSILPPSLDFLNNCSKSDTSSECRSLSPDLDFKESGHRSSDTRDKNGARHESLQNGVSRKSSKQGPVLTKRLNAKSHKEVSIVRKRKSRDDKDVRFVLKKASNHKIPTNARTRSSALLALRKKYKKQRLAAGKKKPPVSSVSEKKNLTTRSHSVSKTRGKDSNVSTKNHVRSSEFTDGKRSPRKSRIKASEKCRSLRSSSATKHIVQRKLKNKTMWLRRAKLVPPIVDIESDSEPEILSSKIVKKSSPISKVRHSSEERTLGRLRKKQLSLKASSSLTSRQILLRKHMQSRLKAKKSMLQTKNVKSRIIAKKTVKHNILKKVKRNLGLKTMSLRKDLQNKRVTRSAKQNIEEMLWSNPEKRTRPQSVKNSASRSEKKHDLPENNQVSARKRRIESGSVSDIPEKIARKRLSGNSDSSRSLRSPTPNLSRGKDPMKAAKGLKSPSSNPPKSSSKPPSRMALHSKSKNDNYVGIKSSSSKSCDNLKLGTKLLEKTVSNSTAAGTSTSHCARKSVDVSKNMNSPNRMQLDKLSKPLVEKDFKTIINPKKSDCQKSSDSILVENKEMNIQNNLNLHQINKDTKKDIPKSIPLNVQCEKSSSILNSGASTSGICKAVRKGDMVNTKISMEREQSSLKHDKKMFKKPTSKDNNFSKTNGTDTKIQKKSIESKSIEICDLVKFDTKISAHHAKKDEKIQNESNLKHHQEKVKNKKQINSLEGKINNKRLAKDNSPLVDKIKPNKCENDKEFSNKISTDCKKQLKNSESDSNANKFKNSSNNVKIENISNSTISEVSITSTSTSECPVQDTNSNKQKIKNEINQVASTSFANISTHILDSDTDDDSDNDISLDHYFKLKYGNNYKLVPGCSLATSSLSKKDEPNKPLHEKDTKTTKKESDKDTKTTKKESDKDTKTTKKESEKDAKTTKKESEKDSQRPKKDGDSSKHKKDKDNSKNKHDKISKKEDRVSKKDSEKSLAKLLKKEHSKSGRKEDKVKTKHKRDGSSSSKSSKHSERDGSKLNRKEIEKEGSASEKSESSSSKKEKSSKKESSKLRSNSCDDAKSPKKKRKHSDLKSIEKIKNLISKSSILNEISGFKQFKRRMSGDKSEFKKAKSKKRKKLALLKDKKLSKKLSSKLLKKYAKKKGLKSKKSKLKRKELLKELKLKSKKQKHKAKGDHHKKDTQEVIKNIDSHKSTPSIVTNSSMVQESSNVIQKSTVEYQRHETFVQAISNPVNIDVQTCTTDIGTSCMNENALTIVVPVQSASTISQTIPGDFVFASANITAESPIIAGVFEQSFSTGTILLAARENISQAPLQFVSEIPNIPAPKTMSDAATNTCEEDIDETLSGTTEHLSNEEMSVGTQTMTPVNSPSPTVEMRTIVTPVPVTHPLAAHSKTELPNQSLPNKAPSLSKSSTSASTPVKSKPSTSSIQSSPKIPVQSSSPKIPVRSSSPKIPVRSSSPKIPVRSSSPKIPVRSSSPKIPVRSSSPKIPVRSSSPKIPVCSSSPKIKRKQSVKKSKPAVFVSSSKCEPFPLDTAKMVSAPVFYPTAEEFQDPLEYIAKIQPQAEQYGICKIIPPSSFKPECKVNDDMRFTAHNQYLHKMLYRWGPNVQHTACIKKHLKTQKVKLEQAPLIGGIELDISKFYHTVQQFGGLQQVIEKKRWQKVADAMRVPRTAQDRVTKLYDAYCKYLVSYDTLPAEEKEKIEEEVITDREKRLIRQNVSSDSEKEDEEFDDENNDCVAKGRSMSLSNFFRIARNTMTMWFKNDPSPEEVENEFWKVVTERHQHVLVHAGNIDSSVTQSGFPTNRSQFAKHPWNLKILTNNSRSILRCMGPLSGITIPTLHVGMLYTTGCWYRDPHSFPWIEYLHTGASKIWYGIPAKGCGKFRTAMKQIMPEFCSDKPLWLSSDTAMVPPELLVKHGASLSRTIQSSGSFVVIFPEAFTSTLCCGYCVSESVYFAPTPWLDLAVKAFQDIRNSCELPAFSLERLLFSIGNDPKPQLKTLEKILPMIENIKSQELHQRLQLHELGLKQFERLPLVEVMDKKKKSKGVEDECEQECEICQTPCYVSMVVYPQEDSVYCLPHALEHIPKKNLKLCKLMYTYNENDLNELVKRISDLVSQLPKHSAKKKSPKKKVLAIEK